MADIVQAEDRLKQYHGDAYQTLTKPAFVGGAAGSAGGYHDADFRWEVRNLTKP